MKPVTVNRSQPPAEFPVAKSTGVPSAPRTAPGTDPLTTSLMAESIELSQAPMPQLLLTTCPYLPA